MIVPGLLFVVSEFGHRLDDVMQLLWTDYGPFVCFIVVNI
jgi:hypothetical protein